MSAILIPPPRVRLADPSGTITAPWYQFLASTLQASVDAPGAAVSTTQIAHWNAAYAWGNHASAGYLTTFTEADPVFAASAAAGVTAPLISDWNTAYGWGNHAAAGYLVAVKAAATSNAVASAVAPSAAYVQAEITTLKNDLNAAITQLNTLMGALRTAGIMLP